MNDIGMDAITYAKEKGYTEIVQLLLNDGRVNPRPAINDE